MASKDEAMEAAAGSNHPPGLLWPDQLEIETVVQYDDGGDGDDDGDGGGGGDVVVVLVLLQNNVLVSCR